MGHDHVNYETVEPRAPGMHFLRDELNCENFGLTVLEADAGWDGLEHDHAKDGEEEVYLLLEGSASLSIEGDTVGLEPGDAVRVDPETTRTLSFDAEGSRMVIVGAP